MNADFQWQEFNEETMQAPNNEPLIQFTENPGIKIPELLVTKDPFKFYSQILD